MKHNYIVPKHLHPNINILTTTKAHGDMRLNEIREKIKKELGLSHIHWLKQVHGRGIIHLVKNNYDTHEADGFITREKNIACAIMTADCLPIVIYSDNEFAAVHAGWRGIYAGIIEEAISMMRSPADKCRAWFGPAISVDHYEVDNNFKQRFLALDPDLEAGFSSSQCSLTKLARIKLEKCGVHSDDIQGGDYCTYQDKDLFYSYRREQEQAGRIATVVWLD